MIEDQNSLQILTPSLSERTSAKLRLDNGLEAYIISDPDASKSAAALAVNIGSWSDPDEQPGLAHFCEHMLFLGTTKYPEESGYDRFITENAGSMNAYTAHDHTNYMFSIKHDAFEPALDRFSWFFKEPLFNESGVEREINAIDQEYAKNVPQDHLRKIYITKALANPKHPNHMFNMGNKLSLVNANPEVLRQWYEQHYSSHLMHLVIYSALPLDELISMVEQKFAEVPRRQSDILRTEQALFNPAHKDQIIYYSPLKDLRTLTLTWELAGEFVPMLDSQPERVVGFILGHEDETSLLAQLKREELAEGLSAGGYRFGRDNFIFQVQVSLTDKGIRRTDDVIVRVFETLARLREAEPPAYIFDEIQQMARTLYAYQSRQDAFAFVAAHSREMLYEDLETYPQVTTVPQRYDSAATQKMIATLRDDNVRITITGKPHLTGVKPDQREKWLEGDYSLVQISDALAQRIKQAGPHEAITLPAPNPYMPADLELLGGLKNYTQLPHPERIADDDRARVYYTQDSHYLVPEVVWRFKIKTPAVQRDDEEAATLLDIYARAVNEELNSLAYTASLGGLNFGVASLPDGLSVQLQGYSDKAPELFQDVIARLKTIRPTEQQFRVYRNSLRRRYENFRKESPFTQGYEELKSILFKDYVKTADKARAIRGINYEDFIAFTGQLFRRSYVEGMLYGNMDRKSAEATVGKMLSALGSAPFPRKEHSQREIVHLPDEHGPFYYTHRIKQPGNATILMLQNGDFSFEARAAQQILAKGLQQPFYSELRTKQQTGYIVHSWAQELERQLFNFFAVQSNTHEGRDLLARYELVIEQFLQEMDNSELPPERFETIRDSLVSELKQPPRNQSEMSEMLNLLAFSYDGDFDWIEKRIKGLEDLDYPALATYAQAFLGRQNHRRLGLLVSGDIPEENRFSYTNVKNARKLKRMSEYTAHEDCP